MLVGSLIGVLAIAAVAIWLTRPRVTRQSVELSDDMIHRIETTGRLELDEEPLDLDEIHEEEKRFWEEEPWDEPEEL